ncbi:hypothetical protein ACFVZM_08120 [Streptomyces sioyaensis]|uniref:hypothetical protein n=1 Tax=Streptomyces sioyaensis TaxID=67364 RepID=UPI0036C9030C
MERATTLRELRSAGEKRATTPAVPDRCRTPMPLRGPEGRSATGAAFRQAGGRVPGVRTVGPLPGFRPVGPLPAKPTETVKHWL